MNVWVFNAPNEEAVDFIYSSIKNGISRFGWSYIDTADLNALEQKEWSKLSDEERDCYSAGRFLLDIEPADWIVHINVPRWGFCTAANVIKKYSFDKKKNKMGIEYTKVGDYRHQIGIDTKSIVSFDRNNPNVLPYISRRLKLQGKHWKIYDVDSFLKSMENLKHNLVQKTENVSHGLYHLKNDLKQSMTTITEMIHRNHPGKHLEEFFAYIFEKVPNVTEVKINGSKFGTDFGADLIVSYTAGLPILEMQKNETMVVQIKSFSGDHTDLTAVDQIKTAITKYEADIGLILSTGNSTIELEKAVETANKEPGKRIVLMTGGDVASFAMKFAANELL